MRSLCQKNRCEELRIDDRARCALLDGGDGSICARNRGHHQMIERTYLLEHLCDLILAGHVRGNDLALSRAAEGAVCARQPIRRPPDEDDVRSTLERGARDA